MKKVKHAIISAAGLGSRLGLDMPKCLIKVLDKEMISYTLSLLEDIEDVRVVVGFKEMDVINTVKQIRKDVVFVRNPHYATTSNAYSLYLATKDIKEPYITIDGDMIIDKDSFKSFINECEKGNDLIGISKSKSEDAVFVELDDSNKIVKFQRETRMPYEWCGIAYFSKVKAFKETKYVYNDIEKKIPLNSFVFECFEVDTPQDLNLLHEQGLLLLEKYR